VLFVACFVVCYFSLVLKFKGFRSKSEKQPLTNCNGIRPCASLENLNWNDGYRKCCSDQIKHKSRASWLLFPAPVVHYDTTELICRSLEIRVGTKSNIEVDSFLSLVCQLYNSFSCSPSSLSTTSVSITEADWCVSSEHP
jgi:hypothetical protein